MRNLMLVAVILLCSGCQYFSYQDSCTDDPNQPGCDGSHQAEGRRK